jgi:hypothetical protein
MLISTNEGVYYCGLLDVYSEITGHQTFDYTNGFELQFPFTNCVLGYIGNPQNNLENRHPKYPLWAVLDKDSGSLYLRQYADGHLGFSFLQMQMTLEWQETPGYFENMARADMGNGLLLYGDIAGKHED